MKTSIVLQSSLTTCNSNEYENISTEQFLKEDQIIQDILNRLHDDVKLKIQTVKKQDLIKFHHNVGTFIRNSYGLWHKNNPINKGPSVIKHGIDCSPNHPDAISMRIIEGIHLILTK